MFDALRPRLVAPRLVDIDPASLHRQGIRGIILDLDNTVTPWGSREISPEVARWVSSLAPLGLTAYLVTNAATDRRVRPVATALGIAWVTRALKPLSRGFRRAMLAMGTTAADTAVIGDQIFTDIWGGNRLGLYTILVDPLSPHEALPTRLLQRPLERLIGRQARLTSPIPATPADE